MLIGGASLNTFWEDPEGNLESMAGCFEEAVALGVDLLVFPEMTLSGFSLDTSRTYLDNTVHRVREMVERFAVSIVFGYVEREESVFYNSASFISPGDKVATYRKRKLFSYGGEEKSYSPGNLPLRFSFQELSASLNICYDLRFPELFRDNIPVELMIVIANWPSRRSFHWETLLRARAIENQCFVLGLNRSGEDGNGIKYGESKSMLVDYDGAEIDYSCGSSIHVWEIDTIMLERLRNWRQMFTAIRDI
jgi:predicted amidohydrolase